MSEGGAHRYRSRPAKDTSTVSLSAVPSSSAKHLLHVLRSAGGGMGSDFLLHGLRQLATLDQHPHYYNYERFFRTPSDAVSKLSTRSSTP